jgi:predicted MFS family arabinose efflux permease
MNDLPPKGSNNRNTGLVPTIAAATLSRLFLNTARRFIYPFAPVFSRGLGVPLSAIVSLIAVNQATSLLAVFFGPLSDRFGYRRMMLAGIGMLAVGMLAAAILPFYGVVLIALFLAGLGKSIFDPAIQAYVSERVPFHRRGTVIGLLEFSWAGSTLIGIPLAGMLIHQMGWKTPFLVFGCVGLTAFILLRFLIPPNKERPASVSKPGGLVGAWKPLIKEKASRGALLFAFFISLANDNLFVVYGVWLEESFGLSIIALGLSTMIIGSAELCGELLTAVFADRLGLKRSVLTGSVLAIICYGTLPLIHHHQSFAFAGLFFIFMAFEFTIVTTLSLCTEILPKTRATMMAAFFAAAGVGRIVGVMSGGMVWALGGITATALTSAGFSLLALISMGWGLHQWRRPL